jgi:hypothetical protein
LRSRSSFVSSCPSLSRVSLVFRLLIRSLSLTHSPCMPGAFGATRQYIACPL